MKFGVREICDVVLKAKAPIQIGNKKFFKNEPVIYFDSLKTSSLEGAATTVYAQGGRGNSRLVAWEGERTVTFTMEDALISPAGFMILSGAGLIEGVNGKKTVEQNITIVTDGEDTVTVNVADNVDKVESIICIYNDGNIITIKDYKVEGKQISFVPVEGTIIKSTVTYFVAGTEHKEIIVHTTETIQMKEDTIYVSEKPHVVDNEDYIYVMVLNDDGDVSTEPYIYTYDGNVKVEGKGYKLTLKPETANYTADELKPKANSVVLVDYYTAKTTGAKQIEITADKFGGNYYLEASTLFRNTNGQDLPAEFIIPNCKIQSNFNFTMASSGDPSTFTFTMDAFPDYTRFDRTKKVLAAIQIIDEYADDEAKVRTSTAQI